MRFQYDPAKAASNLKKHGVSFADAEVVFYDPLALHRLDPDSRDEERFVTVGMGGGNNPGCCLYASWRGDPTYIGSPRHATRGDKL